MSCNLALVFGLGKGIGGGLIVGAAVATHLAPSGPTAPSIFVLMLFGSFGMFGYGLFDFERCRQKH